MSQATSAVQRSDRRRESEIEQIIADNQMVANVCALREELLKRVCEPVLWQMHNRQEHLRPFAGFFQRVLDDVGRDPQCLCERGRRQGILERKIAG